MNYSIFLYRLKAMLNCFSALPPAFVGPHTLSRGSCVQAYSLHKYSKSCVDCIRLISLLCTLLTCY